MNGPRAIVVGGGLAGLSAATTLHDRGWRVTLVERRRLLGGRAGSFDDPAGTGLLDNCQHVLLGCCTHLLRLYERLGVRRQVRFFDTLHFADVAGRRADLWASNLPSPLHLLPAMLRFKLWNAAEKAEILRGMAALRLLDSADRPQLDSLAFSELLADWGQSPSTIRRFWNTIAVSALNTEVNALSARYGVQVFADALLGGRDDWRMGVPAVPLSELYARPDCGQVITGATATRLHITNGRAAGVGLEDGTTLEADAVILAVAPPAAVKLAGTFLPATLSRFEWSPILGVHLWYDRPMMTLPHLALLDTRLHWLFRKDEAGTQLHGVVSAAEELAPVDNDRLLELFDTEVQRVLGVKARLLRGLVVKEKRATFAPRPGVDTLRPGPTTALPGLFLAGDYLQTGWPATMESAVRGGELAANYLTSDL